jgi:hypothetical protein
MLIFLVLTLFQTFIMMKVYNVILADEMTVIELEDKSFRMRVYKANEQVLTRETALLKQLSISNSKVLDPELATSLNLLMLMG